MPRSFLSPHLLSNTVVGVILTLPALLVAEEKPAAIDEEGFTQLFDGKSAEVLLMC